MPRSARKMIATPSAGRRPLQGVRVALGLLGLLATSVVAAGTTVTVDDDSGLASWRWEDAATRLTLVQRLPDQTRAFFGGRGFDRAARDEIAAHCVFQMTLENRAGAPGPLALDLRRWRALADGHAPVAPRTAPRWNTAWERLQVPRAARIAFRWALFPEHQRFQPGDWNMGMLVLEADAGSTVELHATWQRDGADAQTVLPGLRCAEDRHVIGEK